MTRHFKVTYTHLESHSFILSRDKITPDYFSICHFLKQQSLSVRQKCNYKSLMHCSKRCCDSQNFTNTLLTSSPHAFAADFPSPTRWFVMLLSPKECIYAAYSAKTLVLYGLFRPRVSWPSKPVYRGSENVSSKGEFP